MVRKKAVVIGLLIFHLVILGWIAADGMQPSERDWVTVAPSELSLIYQEDENQVVVDGLSVLSGVEECTDLQLLSKEFELRKGVYTAYIDYSTSTNPGDSSFFRSSVVGSNDAELIRSESIRLYNNVPNPYFRVYVAEDTQGRFQIRRDDDCRDAISVQGARLVYSAKMSALSRMIHALIWLLILDGITAAWLNKEVLGKWLRKEFNGVVLTGLCFLLFVSELPMTMSYISTGYDLLYHLYRIQATAAGLAEGVFPVRVQPEYVYGLGYADGTFYGNLFLMVPVVLYALGCTIAFSYKIYVFVINFLTVAVGYYSYRRIVKNKFVALAATAINVMSMHRLVALYNRGAGSVAGAMAFVPLVVAGIYVLYSEPKEKRDAEGWIYLATAMTGILQFHTLTTILTTIVLGIFVLLMYKWTFKKDVLLDIGKAIGAFVLINFYFIIPFVDAYFNNAMNVRAQSWKDGSWQFRHWGVYLAQMFSNKYSSCDDILLDFESMFMEMPLTLGIGALVLLALGLAYLLFADKKNMAEQEIMEQRFMRCTFGIIVLFCLLSSNLFPYAWLEKKVGVVYKFMQNFQYPWRFLAVGCCLIPVLFLLLYKESQMLVNRKLLSCLMALIVFLFVWQGMEFINDYDNAMPKSKYEYAFRERTSMAVGYGEYVPENFNSGYIKDILGQVRTSNPAVEADLTQWESLHCEVTVKNPTAEDAWIGCPIMYYKGYCAQVNQGEQIKLEVKEDDLSTVGVQIPAGFEGIITVSYKEPWYWRMSEVISLLTTVGLIAAGGYKVCKRSRCAKSI